MSRRVFVGVFETEEDILGVARAARDRGLKIIDIYAPYAVHGLEHAAGFKPSRLPVICFVLALLGAGLKTWFEFWTTAVSWPIDVGGKPWNSWPAFIPITFEVMVLFAGVGTVIALLITCRLYPGKKAVLAFPGVTDDRFAILLEEEDATFDVEAVTRLCKQFHSTHVEERTEEVD
jgi:hypothetical protein